MNIATPFSTVMNDLRYDVVRIERDKRTVVAHRQTHTMAKAIVTDFNQASSLPFFWCMVGLDWLAMTADGQNPNTPFVGRYLLQRIQP